MKALLSFLLLACCFAIGGLASQLAAAPLPEHRYSAFGNIKEVEHLNGETRSVYGWDGEHRLKYIEIHDAVTDRCLSLTEFDYDALGRLHIIYEHLRYDPFWKSQEEGYTCDTSVTWDRHNSCKLYYYGDTNKLAAKVYFDGTYRLYSDYGYIDTNEYEATTGVYYTLRDRQGSTRFVYDVLEEHIVARYDYTPYGLPSVQFASEEQGEDADLWDEPLEVENLSVEDYRAFYHDFYAEAAEGENPGMIYRHPDHLYNGYYYHAPSGLYLMRHRAYSPELRQWLSRDPAGEFASESMELYSYVDDNPANGYDPSGLWNIANPFTWGIPLKDGESPWNPLDSSAKWGATGRAYFVTGSFADGLIPFWDPFKESGFYDGCSEDGAFGNRMGELTRDWMLGLAAGGVAGAGIKGAIAGGALAGGASAAITGAEQGLRGSDLAKTVGRSAGIGAVAGGLGGVLGRGLGKTGGPKTVLTSSSTNSLHASPKSPISGYNLRKSLASEQQMAESGKILAGGTSKYSFRGAGIIAEKYGGRSQDWVKKSSSSYTASDGTRFETHWIENIKTGQRIQFKTKITSK